jgi:dTDP-glucose pyrophosphorylase
MKKYNLLIPMVGRGQRFRDEGFTLPKQLIDVGHQQMIDWSMSCIKTEECNMIFVIRRDTVDNNQMDEVLRSKFGDDITIVIAEYSSPSELISPIPDQLSLYFFLTPK